MPVFRSLFFSSWAILSPSISLIHYISFKSSNIPILTGYNNWDPAPVSVHYNLQWFQSGLQKCYFLSSQQLPVFTFQFIQWWSIKTLEFDSLVATIIFPLILPVHTGIYSTLISLRKYISLSAQARWNIFPFLSYSVPLYFKAYKKEKGKKILKWQYRQFGTYKISTNASFLLLKAEPSLPQYLLIQNGTICSFCFDHWSNNDTIRERGKSLC